MRAENTDYATPAPYDTYTIFGRLGQVADPTISFDGTRIAYTRNNNGVRQICSVLVSSRGADIAALTTGPRDGQPSWSPDGRWLAYTSQVNGVSDIFVMTGAGTLQVNLTQDAFTEQDPAWQPMGWVQPGRGIP